MSFYSELVDSYIKKSGLSLAEIAKRMKEEKGIKIDRSYISKLRNDPKYPATEEINRALAEITGGDPEKLVMAGYYEKAPENVKKAMDNAVTSDLLVKALFNPEDPTIEGVKRELFRLSNLPSELYNEELNRRIEDLVINRPQEYLDIFRKDKEDKQLFNPDIPESLVPYREGSMIRVPVLGSIRAGEPIDRVEFNEGYTLVDPNLLRGRDGFALKVKGDSMSGDRIIDGDIVVVLKQDEVQPNDIAVVAINGDEATLKRVKLHGEMVMLVPSNPAYEPKLLPAKNVHIIGKVVEVKFWPK